MRIVDKLSDKPSISFEFFPPKDEAGTEALFQTIAELERYHPTYVSVTYGAGGGTRRLTVDLVRRIKREVGLEPMAHLTCVGATRDEIGEVLQQLADGNIDNVLALRGDPPKGETNFQQTEGGFRYASELVEFIRSKHSFCLAGACYPEKHPDAESAARDLENLKRKVDAGADFLITQLFFDNADYFSFVDRAHAAGIKEKILAGIMPITSLGQVKRFSAGIEARIPAALLSKLEAVGNDAEAVQRLGVEYATAQCRELIQRGTPGVHFYTLNRSRATVQILETLRAEGLA